MVIPIGINLIDWAASLVIDFPDDQIPLLFKEENWGEWGDQLVQCDTFGNNNAPGTADYDEWNSWAEAVYYTMTDNA